MVTLKLNEEKDGLTGETKKASKAKVK